MAFNNDQQDSYPFMLNSLDENYVWGLEFSIDGTVLVGLVGSDHFKTFKCHVGISEPVKSSSTKHKRNKLKGLDDVRRFSMRALLKTNSSYREKHYHHIEVIGRMTRTLIKYI